MSNYLVDAADLTSVANAIRTKGGTSEQLQFPQGFITAVGAIATGGMKPMTLIGTIDYSAEEDRVRHTFAVDNAVEFFITWEEMTNSGSSYSSIAVTIAGANAASNDIITAKSGTKSYGWANARWTGLFWVYTRSAGAIAANTAVGSNAITQYWTNRKSTSPATSISIGGWPSAYPPVSGIVKVYARSA